MAQPGSNKEKELSVIAYKVNTDKEFANRMFTNYDFAKKQFAEAGLEIDERAHEQLISGYKSLNDAAAKSFGSRAFAAADTEVTVSVTVKF